MSQNDDTRHVLVPVRITPSPELKPRELKLRIKTLFKDTKATTADGNKRHNKGHNKRHNKEHNKRTQQKTQQRTQQKDTTKDTRKDTRKDKIIKDTTKDTTKHHVHLFYLGL